jgi:hypothetical protein
MESTAPTPTTTTTTTTKIRFEFQQWIVDCDDYYLPNPSAWLHDGCLFGFVFLGRL